MTGLKYGRAITSAQKEDWQGAQQQLNNLVVNAPNRADVLYDSGVASYKTGKFDEAYAYFDQAAQNSLNNKPLQEKAYFNLGNVAVELKKLEDAIEHYEKTLELNPENQYAKHNLEVVKKMLEQQQQQDQQNDQQDDKQDKQDQNKDQQQDQNKDNKNDDSSKKDDKSSQDQKDDKSQDSKGDNNSGDEGKQEQDNKSGKDQDRDRDEKSEGKPEQEKSKDDGKQKEEKRDQKPDQQKNGDKGEKQKQDRQQDKTPEKQRDTGSEDNNKNEAEKMQGNPAALAAENDEDLFGENEQWMARLLRDREDADQDSNKKMIKAMVDDKLAGHEGQRCW
jgi:Ca-activated chloride channel family protein